MENTQFDVIVIGGGPAGVTAALRAGELGASVALVERGRMGGTCTNDGCVPTRVLAKAARLMRDASQFAEYGLAAPAPELDFAALMRRTQQVVYSMHEKKQLLFHLAESGVKVFSEVGPARFTDAHSIELADGRRLEAGKTILCAGGRARRLDFPGAELALIHSELWALDRLPRSLIIVGAAATGCQLASIFAAFGSQVTLLDLAPRILPAEEEALGRLIQQEFESRGIRVIPGISGVCSIEKQPVGVAVQVDLGGEDLSLAADAVLLSTGWVGNLDSLNLPAAGVEAQGPYVKVDATLRTTAPNIYAAGDITGRMMLVQSAGYDGAFAVENALMGLEWRLEHRIIPHGGFTDPEYGSVGLTEAEARRAGEDFIASTVPYAEMDRAVIDGHPVGLCKLIVSRANHRMLGAHVVGEQALEVVEIAAAGMAAGMRVEQLAELEIAYPTFTAILGLAARDIVTQLGAAPLARPWQALRLPS